MSYDLIMLIAIFPIIALILGIVIITTKSPATFWPEIGRGLWWCGLLVTLLVAAHYAVRIGAG